LSRDDVFTDLEESLQSLQTDYIDLYWLHRDDESMPVGEILEYLNEAVRAGKIRYFGCSNWKLYRIYEAMQYAGQHGIDCFVGNQLLWSLAKVNPDPFDDKTLVFMDDACYELHKETQLAAIPYTSQANGFFEKLDQEKDVPLKQQLKKVFYNDENIKRLERVKEIALDLSKSITEIVLGYLTSQPFTTIPVIGCSNADQLTRSLKAGDLILDDQTVKYLKDGLRI
jgi:aryl-alcohol dehydrogenase-like predicted oxidoreductase